MNFAIYMIGVILVVVALAYGAHLLGLNETWIGIGVLLILGFGIMGAVSKTRRRDPS
jgi:hypothetical protein